MYVRILFLLLMASPTYAQSDDDRSLSVDLDLLRPQTQCSLTTENGTLSFGDVSRPWPATGPSTVTVNAATGQITTSPASRPVELLGGHERGLFRLDGRHVDNYTISLGAGADVTLYAPTGETVTAGLVLAYRPQNLATGGYTTWNSTRYLGTSGGIRTAFFQTFAIGGHLTVAADQALATYTGTVTIQVSCV